MGKEGRWEFRKEIRVVCECKCVCVKVGMRNDVRAIKHLRDWAALDKRKVKLARKIVYLFIYL